MLSYTKRYVNIVSFLISILIYLLLIYSKSIFVQLDFKPYQISSIFNKNPVLVELKTSDIKQETEENKDNLPQNNTKQEQKTETDWKVMIPKISLEAEICEGTSNEVMNEYVGHFEETSTKNGNIGLAAHNRGYAVNYFANIKKLKEGDKIIYQYYDFEKIYIVSRNIIITDEDWSYLQQTEENTITLITCVENEPHYRRCVQAIEKE